MKPVLKLPGAFGRPRKPAEKQLVGVRISFPRPVAEMVDKAVQADKEGARKVLVEWAKNKG